MKKTNWIFGIIIVLIIGGLVSLLVIEAKKPGKYDKLAQCIADSGAKFYGAFWCPHCQATKAMFGKSAKLLPYIECSQPSGKGQLPICDEKGIKGYPTWIFPDGSELTGEQTIEALATKTNCPVQ
jgi:thiol-disulfide isomerase/thioredoxin